MKTVRRPPYPKWNPGYFPCSSLTPLPLSSRRPSVSFGGFGLSVQERVAGPDEVDSCHSRHVEHAKRDGKDVPLPLRVWDGEDGREWVSGELDVVDGPERIFGADELLGRLVVEGVVVGEDALARLGPAVALYGARRRLRRGRRPTRVSTVTSSLDGLKSLGLSTDASLVTEVPASDVTATSIRKEALSPGASGASRVHLTDLFESR